MPDKTLNITTNDAHSFNISCYGQQDAEKVLLFFPAMGVEARYYRHWARTMAVQGYLCCISDFRGHGTSNIRPKSGIDFGYQQMIEEDMHSSVENVLNFAEADSLYLGGHSLGGQLSCLYAGTRSNELSWLSGLLLIASCTIHHSGWPGMYGFGMRLIPWFFTVLAKVLGYFPGHRLNFAGREAKQQILDWAQSGNDGLYQPLGYQTELEPQMEKVQVPLLTISFEDDLYAPRGAVEDLLAKMSGCMIYRQHLKADQYPKAILDHFSWARKQTEIISRIVSQTF
ncbi:MAG: alpha/beta fold hydrolase [Gammaproteobacteria bacterium]|nr:alpha/beta fold hydrolase [Gammaproteobacteria bacterium]